MNPVTTVKPKFTVIKGEKPYERHIPDRWDIPDLLVKKDRWLIWKAVPKSNGSTRLDKVPFSPRSGIRCNPTDPRQLTSFEIAAAFADAHPDISGLGYSLFSEDGIIGGDIDHCIDEEGNISEVGLDVLESIDTYFEVSPSGRGLRFFGTGSLDRAFINPEAGLELYGEKRFLTVTGMALPEKVFEIEEIQSQLGHIQSQYFRSSKIDLAPEPYNFDIGAVKAALKKLDPDRSYEDWTTVGMALKSTRHPEAFEWFREWSSAGNKYDGNQGCLRKWESFTPDGGRTLGSLFHLATNSTERNQTPPRAAPLGIVDPTTIKIEPINWIWDGMLARGKVHVLAGSGGRGKTTLMLAIAAQLSRGGSFPNSSATFASSSVIYISGEDSVSDTLMPRFLAAGGDRTRFFATGNPVNRNNKYFSIVDDIEELRSYIQSVRALALMIDPVAAFCGRGTDNNSATDIRLIMATLQDLASSTGVAIVLLTHLVKPRGDGRDSQMVYRVLGSGAWTQAARIVWGVVQEQNDQRYLGVMKSNLGPLDHVYPYGLDRGLVDRSEHQFATIGPRICGRELQDFSDVDVAPKSQKTVDVEAHLREILARGPVHKQEVIDLCPEIAERTLERVAKDIGVKSIREGVHGKAKWKLG